VTELAEHWNETYRRRASSDMSWFEVEPRVSLELIAATNVSRDAPIVDIGAGASTLVDALLDRQFRDITLLDLSETALAATRQRLDSRSASGVQFIASDVRRWTPPRPFAVWHDRATFHFLTESADRAAYRSALASALPSGAHAILSTFALDGPERCSGLAVRRYSAESLATELGGELTPVEERSIQHVTPAGATQSFVFVRFVRR
jgi:predicted RNA methylase